MKQYLNENWTLRGFIPNVDLAGHEKHIERHSLTDEIEATVPGGIHLDLYRAGLIQNPYYGMNSLSCEWTESRWWCYSTELDIKDVPSNKRELVFEGLDCECEIFIDGVSFGEHNNAFVPMRIDITALKAGRARLSVLFKGAGVELGQNGRTSETRTQKSRFGYKWDFGTRLVNIGIWQDVYIEYTSGARITEASISTDTENNVGIIDTVFDLEGIATGNIDISLRDPDGESIYSATLPPSERITHRMRVEAPRLWYPNGEGEQPLYKLTVAVSGESYEYKVGIRRLRYKRNPGAPENSLPYTVEINGKAIYIRGNNKVPLDHLYGNVDRSHYEWIVRAMANENVNLVRVWGGGIIETETFYELCDEYGILVWQDFIQSSSGIDHIPSKHPDFLERLENAATVALKTKPNHVSLLLWTGGNELTDERVKPITYDDKNIAMLKGLVEKHDTGRLFLPSTPSGPIYTTVFDSPDNHDVHSPWEYYPESHYRNYNRLRLLLHSEFGISAMSDSIPLFMSNNTPDGVTFAENAHHGEYWWHSYRRDKNIYGKFDSPEEYIPYSQWTQAEGLRYIIETERRMAPYASGSMVWQVNEPWPNCDCTNLVDYFGNPKMAYYFVKKAFSKSDVSLKYTSVTVGKTLEAEVCLSGDATPCDEKCSVSVYSLDGRALMTDNVPLSLLPYKLTLDVAGESILFVRLMHKGIEKDYFFSTSECEHYKPMREAAAAKLSLEYTLTSREGEISYYVCGVKNESDVPAYFVNIRDKNMGYAILADDQYFTLLPHESRNLAFMLRARTGLFFDAPDKAPELIARAINGGEK